MKALICHEYGNWDSLELIDTATPKPSPGHVLIQIAVCSASFPDTLIIENKYQYKAALPFSPGGEISGVVIEVGEGVTTFKAGDRVFSLCTFGGMAEYISVEASRVYHLQDELDFITGATIMYNYGTAYHALKDRASLQPGEKVYINGAAGGVGLAALELAKSMGAVVIAGVSTEEKLDICRRKGADILLNYSEVGIKNELKAHTNGKGVDVVFDVVGGDMSEQAFRALAYGGRLLVLGFTSGKIPAIPFNLPLLKSASITGVFFSRFNTEFPEQAKQNMHELTDLVRSGVIRPHINQKYSLHEAKQALLDIRDRKVIGKSVVVVNENL
jgi:NADPH:quinone reductase